MSATNFPLALSSWDDREREALQRVIQSDRYTMGEEVERYEEEFAAHFGSRHAVMVSSGSAANLLMIAACFYTERPRLRRGDEIIVPAVSWGTTYFPLQQYGLHVKFVDIDPRTLNMNLDLLDEAISERTRAVFLVNLLGNPNDFCEVRRIIGDRDILVLEDNCESMGASLGEIQAGTFGVMGSFSSYFSHHISTMEGGCIVTDDDELYHVLLVLRAHGWTRNLPKFNRVTGEKSDEWFTESFRFVLPGYNVRPLEFSGAVGRVQLRKLSEFVRVRRENAVLFQALLGDHPFVDVQREVGESSWFGFSLVVNDRAPFTRSQLVQEFSRRGIESRPIVTGNFLKNESVLRYFDYEVHEEVSAASYIDDRGLFVGNHQRSLNRELSLLADVIQQVSQGGGR